MEAAEAPLTVTIVSGDPFIIDTGATLSKGTGKEGEVVGVPLACPEDPEPEEDPEAADEDAAKPGLLIGRTTEAVSVPSCLIKVI